MAKTTAKGIIDNWIEQLDSFFQRVETVATSRGWTGSRSSIAIQDDPLGYGSALQYDAPLLTLKRPEPQSGAEQRITFEPRHRITFGAAGRIDVYSYPALREAMLLRIPDPAGAHNLTWDEAEERIAGTPWKAFSQDYLPLEADLADDNSLLRFLDDLVA